MKNICKFLLLAAIVCCAAVSVYYAKELYREKYAPRYLKGNAC